MGCCEGECGEGDQQSMCSLEDETKEGAEEEENEEEAEKPANYRLDLSSASESSTLETPADQSISSEPNPRLEQIDDDDDAEKESSKEAETKEGDEADGKAGEEMWTFNANADSTAGQSTCMEPNLTMEPISSSNDGKQITSSSSEYKTKQGEEDAKIQDTAAKGPDQRRPTWADAYKNASSRWFSGANRPATDNSSDNNNNNSTTIESTGEPEAIVTADENLTDTTSIKKQQNNNRSWFSRSGAGNTQPGDEAEATTAPAAREDNHGTEPVKKQNWWLSGLAANHNRNNIDQPQVEAEATTNEQNTTSTTETVKKPQSRWFSRSSPCAPSSSSKDSNNNEARVDDTTTIVVSAEAKTTTTRSTPQDDEEPIETPRKENRWYGWGASSANAAVNNKNQGTDGSEGPANNDNNTAKNANRWWPNNTTTNGNSSMQNTDETQKGELSIATTASSGGEPAETVPRQNRWYWGPSANTLGNNGTQSTGNGETEATTTTTTTAAANNSNVPTETAAQRPIRWFPGSSTRGGNAENTTSSELEEGEATKPMASQNRWFPGFGNGDRTADRNTEPDKAAAATETVTTRNDGPTTEASKPQESHSASGSRPAWATYSQRWFSASSRGSTNTRGGTRGDSEQRAGTDNGGSKPSLESQEGQVNDLYKSVDLVLQEKQKRASYADAMWRMFSPEPSEEVLNSEFSNWRSRSRRRRRRKLTKEEQEERRRQRQEALQKYVYQPLTMARQATIAVTGATLVMVGVPLIFVPIPGPGVAMVFGGLYVLGSEFESAKQFIEPTKEWVTGVARLMGAEYFHNNNRSNLIEAAPSATMEIPPLAPSPDAMPALPPAIETDTSDDDDKEKVE